MKVVDIDTLENNQQEKIVLDYICPYCASPMAESGLTDYRAFWKCSRCDVEFVAE